MLTTLRTHWPEYLMEAAEMGAFMVSAAVFSALLYYPASPVRIPVEGDLARRVIIGLLMGATAICLVRSPWGRRAGPHLTPSLTLIFLRLGKLAPWDAAFSAAAQFLCGVASRVAAVT